MVILRIREVQLLILLLALLACVSLVFRFSSLVTIPMQQPYSFSITKTILVGETPVEAGLAVTSEAQQAGLSFRTELPEGTGLLFVFAEPGDYTIWMKDMRFPIDIVWIRSDGTISTIAENVSPSSYPNAFHPTTPDALYVLEVPAGFAKKHGIAVGMKVVL